MPVNPALLRRAEERRKSLENRVADQITASPVRCSSSTSTSWFAAWIGFRVEPYPFGLLTIVSLEAIFLSTL